MKHEDAIEIISNILQLAIDNAYSSGYDDAMSDIKVLEKFHA
jgi:hypothetical protein